MDYTLRFNEEKNELLKSIRGISFEEIMEFILKGHVLDDLMHPNPKRSNQRIYVLKVQDYVYVVPYIISIKNKEIFLKTIYPSRKYTKFYLEGETS